MGCTGGNYHQYNSKVDTVKVDTLSKRTEGFWGKRKYHRKPTKNHTRLFKRNRKW